MFRIDTLKGLIWDAENYNWAYDALYTILFNIWEFNPSKWNTVLSHLGPFSASLTDGFRDLHARRILFESVRDNIRHQVHQASPEHFPYGPNGTDNGDLVRSMFPNLERSVQCQETCVHCNTTDSLNSSTDLASVVYIKNNKAMTPINKIF